MKTYPKLRAIFAFSLAAFTPSLFAQLPIPSDGSDGALVISNNTVIDLSQAVSGSWTNNNSANTGLGIYDSNKWAVVFKYSSVVISNGATLTFANHPTHAPVVWLVSGDVTINGTISLDGAPGTSDPINLPEPGPGGFRGGAEAQGGYGNGSGFGPGGYFNYYGYYANYPYGNLQIVPLIGGSGGSGGNGINGGGGGGAILIAAAGTITVNGFCHANGGGGNTYYGSGGGIRLVASQILGTGTIQAITPGGNLTFQGRIRLEATNTSMSLNLNPVTTGVSPFPLTIWPAANAPTVQILSVTNLPAPIDPKAAMSANGDDLVIAATNAVAIVLQTSNFPTNGTVNVYIKPRNSSQSILTANYVSGTSNSANWQLTTLLQLNHTVIQARATSP